MRPHGALLAAWSSPVVALHRAVAVTTVDEPAVALELVEELEGTRLTDYHYLPAIKADLVRRLGRTGESLLEEQWPSN